MQFFFQGGIPMVLALAAGLLGLAIGLGQLVLLRRFDLTPLIACSTLATALVGLLGFCYGLYSGLQGVVHADPSSLAMPLAPRAQRASRSASVRATTFVARRKSSRRMCSSARLAFDSSTVRGPAP